MPPSAAKLMSSKKMPYIVDAMATPGWSTAMPIVTGSAVCAPVRANASTATTTAPTATHVFRMHALRGAILLEPEEPRI